MAIAHDRAGRIETYGIDFIPEDERHGRPWELLPVWLSFNMTYFYLIIGGVLTLLGLSLVQSITIILVGNLGALAVGLVSLSGPASGTCTMVVGRAQYGLNGNRLVNASVTWLSDVAYEAINLSICVMALFALLSYGGVELNFTMKILILLATMIANFTLAIYGHATIVQYTKYFSVIYALLFVVLLGFVASHADFDYSPINPLQGHELVAGVLIGFVLVFAGALGPANSSGEYARYLPRGTSRKAIVGWATLGAFLSATVLALLGVLAGTVVDMTDPQTSMKSLMPGWFYVVFLLMVFAGTMANNVLTTYSSGLALQALGLTARRSLTVLIDAALASAMTAYALFISNFLTSMTNFLALMVIWYCPFTAIFVTDLIIRRGRYDGKALLAGTAPYARPRGLNWRGLTAMLTGMGAAFLCVNTTVWQGPISRALDGADISPFVGLLFSAGIYWILMRRSGSPESASGRLESEDAIAAPAPGTLGTAFQD